MAKDKFRKRKEKKRLIRGEMIKRGIRVEEVAASLGYTPQAIYKGMVTSPKVIEAIIAAGVPQEMFKNGGGREKRA